jgi:signal transduction histidine kinase
VYRENRVVGARGVLVDITEHIKTENKMKETLRQMETLNEKLGVVGKLTRHDTRNKLSVIMNNIYIAKQKVDANQKPSECFETIESAIEQIKNIFEFSRIYEKLGTEKLSEINVKKTLDEAITLSSSSDGIKFVNECDDLTVMADSLLRQMFYNLIDNSLKHGEKVTQIRVHYKKEADKLKLIYEDNGVGIPDNEKKKIFEEGYGKGTGYGLYLIEKTCEVYGWSIQETGEFGKGAQFTITIPKESTKQQK